MGPGIIVLVAIMSIIIAIGLLYLYQNGCYKEYVLMV